jgi:hypothetical protein
VARVVSTPMGADLAGRHLAEESAAVRADRLVVRAAQDEAAVAGPAAHASLDLAVTAEEPAEPGVLEGIVGAIVSFLFG